ncbi:MAG: class D sortase, partial [Gammaproteobacteria bacterium]|nr:class D sortase [Gammaproteobacteria bacterium]
AQTVAIAELEAQWQLQDLLEPDRSLWSEQRIAAYERSKTTSDALSPRALLSIPSVGIRVAVFDGTTDRVLNLGAGRVPGTGDFGSAGNVALAGHRDGFFRGLKDVAIGDDITLRHGNGMVSYRVTELFVVDPDAVHVLEPTQEATLTLITCYPFYFVGNAPQRFIVRAVAKAT